MFPSFHGPPLLPGLLPRPRRHASPLFPAVDSLINMAATSCHVGPGVSRHGAGTLIMQ